MTHSNTDNTLSLNVNTSAAPDDVNRIPLATPRCPIPQELDYRGAIVPSTVPSRTVQTALTQLLSFDGPGTENSKDHPPSSPCLPIPPDLISEALGNKQPSSRRALRYIRRNARRAADDEFPFPADDNSKTLLSTVAASIYSTHDFPAQIRVTKRENVYENTVAFPIPSQSRTHPANFPRHPSPPRSNQRRTMNIKPFPAKNSTIAASVAPLTSPSTTAGTDQANVSPSAPFLLRTAAHPGLDRSRDQRPSSPVSSTLAAPPPHMRAFAAF